MLKNKRKEIVAAVTDHQEFLKTNAQKLDIYEGNLLPYVDQILQESLSENYYNAIKGRILPINILQRYVDKVSTTYSNPPKRSTTNPKAKEFLDYYVEKFDMNISGAIADSYSTMFKGFAWEPYVNEQKIPALRELPFDRFLVISDSKVNPEDETIFVKIMGDANEKEKCLLFVYTDYEFDAFYMNGDDAPEYLQDNGGLNWIGTIPFVYGKRQKNKLIPTQDTDMLAFTKAIPVMLSDAAGAQMFQCFSILYGVDVNFDNLKISPNAFWSLKSDQASTKEPKVGTINPQADTGKVVQFIMNAFVFWLETKGIRVGSVGNVDGGNAANGISKIIDEMDVQLLVDKAMSWFEKDESELFNEKLPLLHKYWIESGAVDPSEVPALVDEPMIEIEFERPEPMVSRKEEVETAKAELEMGVVLFEDVVRQLHPEYDETKVKLVVAAKLEKQQSAVKVNNGVDEGNNQDSQGNQAGSAGSDSRGNN